MGRILKEPLCFVLRRPPVTKKNSGQIVTPKGGGRPFLLPSKRYKEYQEDCGWLLKCKGFEIDCPVNIKALYFMPTRRKVDLVNLHSALHDMLVHHKVIADDNSKIIISTDGSRVFYDKDNPRTEVTIEPVYEQDYQMSLQPDQLQEDF